MYVILYKLFDLRIDKHHLFLALIAIIVLQIEADLCHFLISSLEPVFLQKLQELLLLTFRKINSFKFQALLLTNWNRWNYLF